MKNKNIPNLEESLFVLQYENKILRGIILNNELERWVPGCSHPYTEAEHLARYNWVSQYVNNCVVYDIACGTGKGSKILSIYGKAKKVVSFDLDSDTIHYASIVNRTPNITFRKNNAEELKFTKPIADVVVSFETIEHLHKPEKFLKGVQDLLKENGTFVVSTPISRKNINSHPENKYHINEWNIDYFKSMISKYFQIEEIYLQKGEKIVKYKKGIRADYQIVIAKKINKNSKLFVITSAINLTSKKLSYSDTRSIYSPKERINHTFKTIDSIRKNSNGSKILLLELGKYSNDLDMLKNRVDEYVFLGNDPVVRFAVDGQYKGFGEAVGLIKGFRYIKKNNLYKYVFKISGRYYLTSDFDNFRWRYQGGLSAKIYGKTISTRLYGIPFSFLNRWYCGLIASIPLLLIGLSIEAAMYKIFYKNINNIATIGVGGRVAVDGSEICE